MVQAVERLFRGPFISRGSVGTKWLDVRAYVNNTPVSADDAPSGGSYTLSVDTTKLPNGATTLAVIAFSAPASNPKHVVYTQEQLQS